MAFSPVFSQTVGMQFARSERGAGGQPAQKTWIPRVAGPDSDDRSLPLGIAGNGEDDCGVIGDQIDGIERLDHDDITPA